MSQQHTPGPWHVMADPVWTGKHPMHEARFIATSTDVETFGHPGEPDEDRGWRFVNDDAVILCTMPDSDNQSANARLIAAAPELIHACELAFAELGKMGCECDCENMPTYCPVCACRAAIAKAKGGAE